MPILLDKLVTAFSLSFYVYLGVAEIQNAHQSKTISQLNAILNGLGLCSRILVGLHFDSFLMAQVALTGTQDLVPIITQQTTFFL